MMELTTRSVWGCAMIIGLLALSSPTGQAEDARQPAGRVHDAASVPVSLLPTEGLSGSFKQRIEDTQGNLLSESRGQFALRKPHFFRWSIQEPGQQLLVADGRWLWQYDLDLETVSRQPMELDGNAPLRLLTQSLANLEGDYSLQWNENVLTLTPLNPNPAFQAMGVHYDNGVPQRLTIDDSLGQTVDILFVVDAKGVPPLSTFEFEPPADIDVYTQEP